MFRSGKSVREAAFMLVMLGALKFALDQVSAPVWMTQAQAQENPIAISATWPEPYKSTSLEELVERQKGKNVEAWISSNDVLRQSNGSAAIRKSATVRRMDVLDKLSARDWRNGLVHVLSLEAGSMWRVDFSDYSVSSGWPVEDVGVADKGSYYWSTNFFFPKDGVSRIDRQRLEGQSTK
jgi:hypothetical protein